MNTEAAWKRVIELVGEVEPEEDVLNSIWVSEDDNGDTNNEAEEEGKKDTEDGILPINREQESRFEVEDFKERVEDPMEVDDDSMFEGLVSKPILLPNANKETEPMEIDLNEDDDSCSFSDSSSEDDMAENPGHRGVDLRLLVRILDEGKTATAGIADSDGAPVVLVLGATGVGKSTFIQAIAGHKIKRGFDKSIRKGSFLVDGEGEQGFDIGHGLVSQTRHVRSYFREETSTFYVDSSGFEDTKHIETDIATSICVAEIAAKAGKLRFVVLINASTFFVHRANELRKILELVAKIIGHNFEDHKKSFSFLFTHCDKAFESINDISNPDETLSAFRNQLVHLLKETKKATPEPTIRNLISFLRSSLAKDYPYCDVFDPVLSDIKSIRKTVEPSTMHAISQPAEHVKCSLTVASRLVIEQELRKRMSEISNKVYDEIFDDAFRDDVVAVCSLASHVDRSFCKDQASALLALLAQATTNLETRFSGLVQQGLVDGSNVDFTVDSAAAAKKILNQISFLDATRWKCEIRLANESMPSRQQPESNRLDQVLSFYKDQLTSIQDELSCIGPYIFSEEENAEDIKPDIGTSAAKLKKLVIWATEFGGHFEKLMSTAQHDICSVIDGLVYSYRAENLGEYGGLKLLRVISLLRATSASRLVGSLRLRESNENGFALDQALQSTMTHVRNYFEALPRTVKQASATALSCPTNSEDGFYCTDLRSVLYETEAMHIFAQQEGLELGNFRHSVISALVASFLQKHGLCMRLVRNLNDEAGRLLEPCIDSLQSFAACAPTSMRNEGRLIFFLDQLRRELAKSLSEIVERLTVVTEYLETSGGIVGDVAYHKRCFSILESFLWFDSFCQQSMAQDPFIAAVLAGADERISSFTIDAAEYLTQILVDIMSESGNQIDIQEKAKELSNLFADLRKVGNMRAIADPHVQSFLSIFTVKMTNWCKETFESDLPDSVREVSFDQLDKRLSIALALKGIDHEVDAAIDDSLLCVNLKLDAYCREIESALSTALAFELHGSMLQAGHIWSRCCMLPFPTYEEMRARIRSEVVKYAESVFSAIRDAKVDEDLKDLDEAMKPLIEAVEYVDNDIDSEASRWENIISQALTARREDLDQRFNGFVEDRDFDAIKEHLSMLKEARHDDQYRKCLRYLSTNLSLLVEEVQLIVEGSSMRGSQADIAKQNLLVLRNANASLCPCVKSLPPTRNRSTSWELSKILSDINCLLETSLHDWLDLVSSAVDEIDFVSAVEALDRSILLHGILTGGDTNSRKELTLARTKVRSLLAQVDANVTTFLSSLSDSPAANTRKRGNRPEFPPDTSFLRTALGRLGLAIEHSPCPKEIRDCYDSATKKLSGELEEICEKLVSEADQGNFTRPLKVFEFLRAELVSKGLQKHLELTFDVSTALDDISESKYQQQQSMRKELLDEEGIDRIADRLKKASNKWSWTFWRKSDYDEECRTITRFIQDFVDETTETINSPDPRGLGQRLCIVEQIQSKLGEHLSLKHDPMDLIKPSFSNRLARLTRDMAGALSQNNLDKFKASFTDMVRVLNNTRTHLQETQDPSLKSILEVCYEGQKATHISLFTECSKRLETFRRSFFDQNYHSAERQASELKDFGYFFVSTFAQYREELCSGLKGAHLHDLDSLVREAFGKGKIVEVGKSLATLNLSYSATARDVRRAYKSLSRRWHPDKNSGDIRASEKFRKIKDAANILEESRNLELFRCYDFVFLFKAAFSLSKTLHERTKEALKEREYILAERTLHNLQDIEHFSRVFNDRSRCTSILNVDEVRARLLSEVRHCLDALVVDIKKAHSGQDFSALHHSFESLESLEDAFKSHKEVVPTSLTSQVLEDLRGCIQVLKNDSTFLAGLSESQANRRMEDFALQLIKIGRYVDGFPRMKRETMSIIHRLLNLVQAEPWGVSFLFKLGLLLENAEMGVTEDDERVGRTIVDSFKHFQDVRTVVFNREVITADVADSVSQTRTEKCGNDAVMTSMHINKQALTRECERYELLAESFFKAHVQHGWEELVAKVFVMVQNLRSCKLTSWDDSIKSKITDIVSGVFATFTIIQSGESFMRFEDDGDASKDVIPSSVLFRPHSIQVIAVLRLLGIGSNESVLPNHIMEIRTGEGKSLILGALSVVLALLGFSVRSVCYSEHLSERDHELFRDVFVAFNVDSRITYSKITSMTEDVVAEKGDIRQMTLDLIKGEKTWSRRERGADELVCASTGTESDDRMAKRRRAPSPPSISRAIDTSSTNSDGHAAALSSSAELVVNTEKDVPESASIHCTVVEDAIVKDEQKASSKSFPSNHNEGKPLPLNGDEILLVDEVDVFFGPDFYGQTYNQVAELEDDTVERFMRKLWSSRKDSPTMSQIQRWPEHTALNERFNGWKLQIDKEVKRMLSDCQKFEEPQYVVDGVHTRIGYTQKDSIEWELTFGYRTAFAYLHEAACGRLKGPKLNSVLRRALCLRISCGQYSYANISPTAVLGVSGTVKALSSTERAIVKDFGVDTYTYVPSVYGENKLLFDRAGRGILIETDKKRHMQTIANEMHQATRDGRAALVFFESDERLLEFQKTSHWRAFRHGNVLTSKSNKETRKYVIDKAATSKQVTIATAVFGRGTDFFCKDSQLEKAGGLLVIQTFLSVEKSEELQIQGRTARQGKKGSYCMILLDSDLMEAFGVTHGECSSRSKDALYDFLDQRRQKCHTEILAGTREAVAEAEERDTVSRNYLNALCTCDRKLAKKWLDDIYNNLKTSNGLNFCRMVCMSDATGSMSHIWNATRDCTTEMLRRIDEIGQGQFELLWAAYRDYSDGEKILEKSRWTKDPNELISFVSGISCFGGADYDEAVEWALKDVNEEHDVSPVTRVLLIGDAPPHREQKGTFLNSHSICLETDYGIESNRLKERGIPVYCFRLNDEAELKRSFDTISSITGGESQLLILSDGMASNKLIDCVCETALGDIGGSELIAEYRARQWD